MATDATKVLVGAATVSFSDYVTAGGAGSFTDIGHTKAPVTLTPTFEQYEAFSERAYAPVKIVPTIVQASVVIPMLEMTAEWWRVAFRQPSTNLTGTSPDDTLLVGDPSTVDANLYRQIKIVGPAIGAANTSRTFTFWKCFVTEVAEIPFAKADSQVLQVTFSVLYDDSVATADKLFKMVEA